MPAHARRGSPGTGGTRASQEVYWPAHRVVVRHVRVSTARVEQCVQCPALLRPRLPAMAQRSTAYHTDGGASVGFPSRRSGRSR
jgi:hypothetical protein